MYLKKRRFTGMMCIALMLFIIVAPVVSAYVYAAGNPIEVRIVDNGVTTTVFTSSSNVSELLAQQDITVGDLDIVTPDLTEEITENQTIEIKRAKDVVVLAHGKRIPMYTANDITKEYLKKLGIESKEEDFLTESYDSETNETIFTLVEVTQELVYEDVVLPSSELTMNTSELEKGQSRIKQQGRDGLLTQTYEVRYENGQEVSKVLLTESIVSRPVDTIKEIGTAEPKPKATGGKAYIDQATQTIYTPSGKELKYKNVIDMTATAYDLSYESCGKRPGDRGYGITASGMKAGYGVVAVDPRVIPLGTKLYIESPNGSWTYGESVAGDTGGAIKGNKIDLFFPTRSQCLQFGRQTARVYVLE